MTPERWQRIEQLYHEALERDVSQRAAFLDEACAEDEMLRREVEALLAANNQPGGFLDEHALAVEAKEIAAEQISTRIQIPAIQHFSHYQILSKIGAGGMGEVYLARDTKLERRVAIKVLPPHFTADTSRLQRFAREARATSLLNHPNIITIYEIGEIETPAGKTHFIATEFIEGETMRRRMSEGLELREALNIAIQTASALDAAHQTGIVHRDIKPENIMVRPDGLVKVLDFGLAKLGARKRTPFDDTDTNAQTAGSGLKTEPGMIMGTLRYMSPEQARGRELDARTDIFSLGVVLYEMIARQPLFAGETSADVIAAILHKQPEPLAEFAPDTPDELERIVRKALAKDCRDRYQTARDLQIDLETLKQESELSARLHRSGQSKPVTSGKPAALAASQSSPPRSTLKRKLLLAAPVGLSLLGVLWWVAFRRGGQVEIPPLGSLKNVQIHKWPSAPGESTAQGTFSPDAKWVAFTSTQGGKKNIWVKQATTAGDAQPSTQDEFLNLNPIWSPNGEEIAFVSRRGGQYGIWRKPPFGGTPARIKTLAVNQLCSWSKDGATIYYERENNLFALEVDSGKTRQLTQFEPGKTNARSFSLSPDERRIAYCSSNGQRQSDIWVVSVNGGAPWRIASSFTGARNTVWHSDNHRLFFSARESGTYQIFVADLDGRQPVQLTFGDRDSFVMDVSADGTKVLSGSSVEESNIWKADVARAEEVTVASDIDFEFWPDVSPDGQMIAYGALKNFSQGNHSNSSILVSAIGSPGKPRLLVKEGYLVKWAPDGNRLAFLRNLSGGVLSLGVVNLLDGKETQLAEGKLNIVETISLPYNRNQTSAFAWSPDGGKLVYGLTSNGQTNLWLAAADGSGNVQLTSHNDLNVAIENPLWSADGKRLTYLSSTKSPDAKGLFGYDVWVKEGEANTSKTIFQATREVRLLGWSATEQELLLAVFNSATGLGQSDAELLRVDAKTGQQRAIAVLPSAYRGNIHLSVNSQTIAFTSHWEGKDNIWLIPVSGGQARKLTGNNDPNLYFSSLSWSPDNQAIYFGKQTRHGLFSMFTNFK